jgi:hypothetical protein
VRAELVIFIWSYLVIFVWLLRDIGRRTRGKKTRAKDHKVREAHPHKSWLTLLLF